jgi:hypothetical protein
MPRSLVLVVIILGPTVLVSGDTPRYSSSLYIEEDNQTLKGDYGCCWEENVFALNLMMEPFGRCRGSRKPRARKGKLPVKNARRSTRAVEVSPEDALLVHYSVLLV